MRILSIYDASGVWSGAFADLGCEVVQVDITSGTDARTLEHPGEVDGIIAQPPCTHFAVSGARWWDAKDKQAVLFGESPLYEGLALMDAALRWVAVLKPRWWVLENPVGRMARYLGPPSMTYNPCDFAGWADDPASEAYTKRTCLWGQFEPPHERAVAAATWGAAGSSRMRDIPPGPERQHIRSRTPQGFARAFADANGPEGQQQRAL